MSSIRSISDITRLLRRRLWLVLLIAGLGSALSVVYALSQPKTFEATAVIQIETPQVGQSTGAPTAVSDARLRLQLIEQRLMARDHLVRMIDKHGLFAEATDLSLARKIDRMRVAARIVPITMTMPGFAPGGTPPSGLSVTVTLGDPDKAAEVANDFVQAVIRQNRERRLAVARETLQFYSAEEARVDAAIAAIEARIADFKRANADALPASLAAQRTELTTLREALLEIEQQVVTLETESTRRREEVYARDITRLTEQRDLIADRIATIERSIAAAPGVERELGALTREMTQLQDQLSAITRARAEAEMASALENRQQQERFEVLETAIPPTNPVSASRKKIALAGGVASLLAGLALALALELLNPRLRTASQLRDELEITPVVTIPVVRLPRERRAQMLRWLMGGLAVALVLPVLIRLAQDRIGALRLPVAN
ncbi:tyrosine-protein kinase Etk/Wzc [Roseovarius sp. MBR-78]|uniref:Wzz/FepE/Etk N-terminal domain-containing protein n=1 Tax=Roseovarius sp. MBR-78 TaxID=3156460 RepID=UPI003399E4E6